MDESKEQLSSILAILVNLRENIRTLHEYVQSSDSPNYSKAVDDLVRISKDIASVFQRCETKMAHHVLVPSKADREMNVVDFLASQKCLGLEGYEASLSSQELTSSRNNDEELNLNYAGFSSKPTNGAYLEVDYNSLIEKMGNKLKELHQLYSDRLGIQEALRKSKLIYQRRGSTGQLAQPSAYEGMNQLSSPKNLK